MTCSAEMDRTGMGDTALATRAVLGCGRGAAEAAPKFSEERYRELFENASDILYTLDLAGNITSLNKACERITGYSREEALRLNFAKVLAPEYRDLARRMIERKLDDRSATVYEVEVQSKLGRRIRLEVSSSPIIEGDTPVGIQGVARDVTERRQTERSLSQLASIVASSHDAIISTDLAGTILSWNSGAERIYGYTEAEMLGRPISVVQPAEFAGESLGLVASVGRGEQIDHLETKGLTKGGREIVVSLSISPVKEASGKLVGASRISRDITEQKSLETQLRQAQKMEAVGRLAGGIAHDFNNILTAIMGYSDLLLEMSRENAKACRAADQIHKSAVRAATLTRQLLAFSRRQVLQPRLLDLNVIVADVDKVLRRLIGEDIELASIPGAALGAVEADPGQIEQVLMNLAINARDAMPQGGKITIETANVELDEEYAIAHRGVKPGSYVMLAVSDNGCGMTEDLKANIFEPFFTTKDVGQGSGLGLAMVHGVIKQSGGTIYVYSEPGQGSTFKMYLPRAVSAVPTEAPIVESAPPAAHGVETIQLVEDEDSLRGLVRSILQRNGYAVLEARNGREAAQTALRHSGPIHLLLTDVVMPEMGGRQVAAELLAARPQTKVLYMSGYTDEAILRHGILDPSLAFLQKPFTADALRRKVREVLDGPQKKELEVSEETRKA